MMHGWFYIIWILLRSQEVGHVDRVHSLALSRTLPISQSIYTRAYRYIHVYYFICSVDIMRIYVLIES